MGIEPTSQPWQGEKANLPIFTEYYSSLEKCPNWHLLCLTGFIHFGHSWSQIGHKILTPLLSDL